MEKITNITELNNAIEVLEQKVLVQEKELEVQFHEVMFQFNPANIFKSSITGFQKLMPAGSQLFKLALGIGAGFLGKKFLVSRSSGILGKAAATLVEIFLARYLTKRKARSKPTQEEPL